MLDIAKLNEAVSNYKEAFVKDNWQKEKYKWEAVKWFQDNWDINAPDFAAMLTQSLAKTYNLLASMNRFPAKMITIYAKAAPEEVRAMFISLFDENENIVDRIEKFKTQADIINAKYRKKETDSHYQDENAISVYLWLRYPEKYYIYKYGEVKKVNEFLNADYTIVQGRYEDNLKNFYALYDEIRTELQKDNSLSDMLASHMSDVCYPDKNLCTLTVDLGFYISRYLSEKEEDNTALDTQKVKDNSTSSFWKISHGTDSTGISETNKRIFEERKIAVVHGSTKAKGISKTTQGEEFINSIKKGDYFYLCYGSKIVLLGQFVSDRAEENAELRDGWMERPYRIIAEPVITEPYSGEQKWWTPNNNSTCIKIDDLNLFESLILKPYFNMNVEEFYGTNDGEKTEKYTKADFLNEAYMSENKYDMLVAVLKNKKNIILQGAPGVGKTFAARRLAYSIMGEKDNDRIEFVQFHQNYSYEDFMMGYKPEGSNFVLKHGIFYRFCKKAENKPDKDFFFIIDEINRGNMSKIFGELLMLIEKDYRGTQSTLAYNGEPFSVPENLYIIGMMNTADRSLAMIDYALRRRFSFFEIEPGFDSEGFKKYEKSLNNETFSLLISKIRELNNKIENDKSLGKGFMIGHSYFCGQTEKSCTEEWLRSVVDFDIIPMLNEYWFDDLNEVQRWTNILQGVFQ